MARAIVVLPERLTDQRQAFVGGQAQAHRVHHLLPPVRGDNIIQEQGSSVRSGDSHLDRIPDSALFLGDHEFGTYAADHVVRADRPQLRHGLVTLINPQAQRGAKLQPAGRLPGEAAWPGMPTSDRLLVRRGMAPIRRRV